MKTKHTYFGAVILFLVVSIFSGKHTSAQGRIVINEIMPWSGCNATSEFIELLNFGPGPMNIGCYIVTNGTYSVTIPPNTILQPKQYYLLSGQNTLVQGCGNQDSTVQVDLNWTTCNCTNNPIPTTGNGFMQNGGGANEKIVLLDPNLTIIDAVSRQSTPGASVSITTPAVTGCTNKSFNLDTMNIAYESINTSTGIDNSFARKVDGDCGWAKTTSITARAPNATGNTASAAYSFTTVSASNCQTITGSISIDVSAPDVSTLFPMNYTLAYDADSNNTFNGTDQYLYGIDNTSPAIDINSLAYGRYRITVASSSSCNLKNFDFFVFNCYGVILPVQLVYFRYEGLKNGQYNFRYEISMPENLHQVILEKGDGMTYEAATSIAGAFSGSVQRISAPASAEAFFRLKLIDRHGRISYSLPVKAGALPIDNMISCWPNPAQDMIHFRVPGLQGGTVWCSLFNAMGKQVKELVIPVQSFNQLISFPVQDLPAGLYQVRVTQTRPSKQAWFRFVR